MRGLRRWLIGVTAIAIGAALPAMGNAATPHSSSSAVLCAWGSVGTLPLPTGQVAAARTLPAPSGFQLVAPTGSGGWYGVLATAKQGHGWPEAADLVKASLRPGAPVRTLAHVETWPLGVAVADGLIVNEDAGALSAWNASGRLVWRVSLDHGAGLQSDNVAIHAEGGDVIALVAPGVFPNMGQVVGVNAATGRVNLRVSAPDLDPVDTMACSAGTLYVVEPSAPAPGHPVRPGHAPPQKSVIAAFSTHSDKLLWQHAIVFRSNCSQWFPPPYASPTGLLVTRAPSVCTTAAGTTTGTVTTELFAPTTGRVLWQASYPWSPGIAVTNGAVVALPLGNGRVAVRDYATGKVLGGFRTPPGAALVFGTQASIVGTSCPHGPKPTDCKTLVWNYAGKEIATLPGGAAAAPFAQTHDRLYAYGRNATHLVVFRLKNLGPPQG